MQGPRTEAGLRTNISVGLTYTEAWLGGNGCIPIHGMMEDAATAEIARTQAHPSPVLANTLAKLAFTLTRALLCAPP